MNIKTATIKLLRPIWDCDSIDSIDIYKGKKKVFWVDRHFMADFTAWTICLRHNYVANMLDMIEDETGIRFDNIEIEEVLY